MQKTEMITPAEAREMLGITAVAWGRLISTPSFPAKINDGRKRLYFRKEVVSWVCLNHKGNMDIAMHLLSKGVITFCPIE